MIQLARIIIVLLACAAFATGQARARAAAGGDPASLHSRPFYHGFYAFLWVALSGLAARIKERL